MKHGRTRLRKFYCSLFKVLRSVITTGKLALYKVDYTNTYKLLCSGTAHFLCEASQ